MKARAAKTVGLLDALEGSFKDALRSPDGIAEPVALLWTDMEGEWRGAISALRTALPQLFVLGEYDPSHHMGPAIWLKCIVDRTLPEFAPAPGMLPILYLPGVSRQELRAAGDCRYSLQPLIELQFRGRVWHQQNGRDWSVEAFLVSEDGLGLDIAQDARTREALIRALPLLVEGDIGSLRGRHLDADDFDKLAVSDPVRDLLRWMSNPEVFRKGLDASRWQAFRNVCRAEFGIDPDQDGASVAARSLILGGGKWDSVWRRFCEAPKLYPGIPDLLREPMPGQAKLAFDDSRSPRANDEAEDRLRRDLAGVASLAHREACERVLSLEQEHGRRRDWVWVQLGESPFAEALQHLARLAKLAKLPLGGPSVDAIILAYTGEGWLCDKAALQAVANGRGATERTLIAKTVQALYEPWLRESALHFQELVSKQGDSLRGLVRGIKGEKDTCVLFVDGLRFDVGGLLLEKLEARSLQVRMSHRLTPLPTVTATAKPVASPAYDSVEGSSIAADFAPVVVGSKQPATTDRLRGEIERHGVEVFGDDELRFAGTAVSGGWTEIGCIDELGHKLGAGLAAQLNGEVETIADRVVSLLQAGWKRVRIVTDHGWLLLPRGLPKVDLPAFHVETKWARCAIVRGNSTPSVPIYSWYFNPQIRIASPPGIACFGGGKEYTHGGVSPQECVVPELTVERGADALIASIASVQWRGMRCRVSVRTNDPKVRVDIRTNWKRADTSIAAATKELGIDGEASLIVEDDRHEHSSATVVVVSANDEVLDRATTTVGEGQ